jgi:hypothetical protein
MAITRKILGPSYNDANPWLTTGVHFISEGYNSEASFVRDVRKVVKGLQRIEPFNLTRLNKYWMSVFSHYVPVGTQGISDANIHFGTSAPSSGSTSLDTWFNTTTDTLELSMSNVQSVLSNLSIRESDGTAINLKTTFFSDTASGPGESRMTWNSVFIVLIPEVSNQVPANKRNYIEAELKPADATEPYVVATSLNGYHGQIAARALCVISGLDDEYEGAGAASLSGDTDYYASLSPNLLFSDTPPTGTPATDFKWLSYMATTEQASSLTVNANPSPGTPNSVLESKPVNSSGFELHEGGGGAATKIYRGSSDGLMRRKIGTPALPVKDIPLEVGPLGNLHLRSNIHTLKQGTSLTYSDPCNLETKFSHYEWWWSVDTDIDSNLISTVNNEHFVPTFGYWDDEDDPKWDYKYDINATDGLVFNDMIIKWTDGTNIHHSNVLKKLQFVDLQIVWNDASTYDIDLGADIAAAGSNSLITVQYLDADNNSQTDFQRGHKLIVTRKFQNGSGKDLWEYKVVISVCLRDIAADFEPGGALEALKIYPEIGFTWKKYATWTKTVDEFRGTVKMTKNPASSMNNNSYSNFFTDSNYPTKPNYRRGQWPVDFIPYAAAVLTGFFELFYPSWDYLFDYVHTQVQSTTEHIMVYGSGSGAPAKEKKRSATVTYPSGGVWDIEVTKMPRQGAYDNVHTHGDMGMHKSPNTSKKIMMAPFCLESCVHMHWRWGVEGTYVAGMAMNGVSPSDFKGWSKSGAKSVLGAPMIPPNQELSVKLEDTASGTSISPSNDKVISYKIKIDSPKQNCQQVIMENGLSIAYRGNSTMDKIIGLSEFEYTASANTTHKKMMQLYSLIRFYWGYGTRFKNQTTTQMVPEGPVIASSFNLENL